MNKKSVKPNRTCEQTGYDLTDKTDDHLSKVNELTSPVETLNQDQNESIEDNPWLCEDMEWGLYLA